MIKDLKETAYIFRDNETERLQATVADFSNIAKAPLEATVLLLTSLTSMLQLITSTIIR